MLHFQLILSFALSFLRCTIGKDRYTNMQYIFFSALYVFSFWFFNHANALFVLLL